MKHFNILPILFLIAISFISSKPLLGQVQVSEPVCAFCGANILKGEQHKKGYPCYKESSVQPPSPSTNNVEQMIVQTIFTNMFNSLLSNSNTSNQTETQKLRAQQEEQVRQQRLAAMRALQKKYNDSIVQAKHDKMMKDYKTLDAGTKDLQYKGLIDKDYYDPSVVVFDEQKWLDNNTQTWLEYQKEQFRIRTEQPNYWCERYYENLKKQDSLLQAKKPDFESDFISPKRLSEVQAGDIILVGNGGKVQMLIDNTANSNNSDAAHTLTCVKVVNGKRFYLDNQFGEGPRIITEDQVKNRYQKRDLNVASLREQPWGIAQPLNKEEAEKLWNKALELHTRNRENVNYGYETKDKSEIKKNYLGTNYGTNNIFNSDNMVCSESSWTLINSAGRFQIPSYSSKLLTAGGIEFSPSSFYSSKQYFIITPLVTDK